MTTLCSWCLREANRDTLAALSAGMSHSICSRHLRDLYPTRLQTFMCGVRRCFSVHDWSLTTAFGWVCGLYLMAHVIASFISPGG